jgi:hypothetical protein
MADTYVSTTTDSSTVRTGTLTETVTQSVTATTVTYNNSTVIGADGRVKIKMLPSAPSIFYKDSSNTLLSPLAETNGVVFPYQPKIDLTFSASYQSNKVAQTNFAFYAYESSELKPFTISGEFPVRNEIEGQYVMAALTFLRSMTMMFTGNDTNYAGAPPLLGCVEGMGFGGLDYIPVGIGDVTTSFPDNIDYISVPLITNANEIMKMPSLLTINISCTPMFSRLFATNFSTLKYSAGTQRLMGPSTSSNGTSNSSTTVSGNTTVEITYTATTLDTESDDTLTTLNSTGIGGS